MPSIWNAGIETFDKILADRDAARFLQEDRDRRAALDEEQRQYRQEQMEMQRRQQANAEARQAQSEIETRLERDREMEKKERVDKFLSIASDPKQPEELRSQAAARLAAEGVAGGTINAVLGIGKKTTKPLYTRDPKGIVRDAQGKVVTEVPDESVIWTQPQPDRGPQVPVSHRDNPNLPQGVMNWINSIGQRGVKLADARKELSSGWAQQMAVHPSADLSLAAKYLSDIYAPGGLFAGNAGPPPAAPAAPAAPATPAAPAPSRSVEFSPSGAFRLREQSVPAAPALPGGPTPDQMAEIRAALAEANLPETPANVQEAMRQLFGGR